VAGVHDQPAAARNHQRRGVESGDVVGAHASPAPIARPRTRWSQADRSAHTGQGFSSAALTMSRIRRHTRVSKVSRGSNLEEGCV
jgi:hypothetical protein